MKTTILSTVLLMTLPGAVMAQAPDEQLPPIDQATVDRAMARLRERQAQAEATRPTTRPAEADRMQAMRNEIMSLRRQLYQMRSENETLRVQLTRASRERDRVLDDVQATREAAERAAMAAESVWVTRPNYLYNGTVYPYGPVSPLTVFPSLPPFDPNQAPLNPQIGAPQPDNALSPTRTPPNNQIPSRTPRNFAAPRGGAGAGSR